MSNRYTHIPVLLNEVIASLNLQYSTGIVVDMTFGAGGYSTDILSKTSCKKVYAIDCDPIAAKYAETLRNQHPARFQFFPSKFSKAGELLQKLNISAIDAAVFDIGVSSMQIDDPKRGFSYMKCGPLSMRMDSINIEDADDKLTAFQIVNSFSEAKIAEILLKLGDEPLARKIAKEICRLRSTSPIKTTTELAQIVQDCYAGRFRQTNRHPASRTFQAFRICINNELNELKLGLESAFDLLKPGGRIAALEDNIVKEFIVKKKKEGFASKLCSMTPTKPSNDEVTTNVRSRTANMRIIEKIMNAS